MPKKYGKEWPSNFDDLNIEIACFRNSHSVAKGGLGKFGHCKRIIDLLWGKGSGSHKIFEWNPWAEKMIRAACEHVYLSVSGAGGCGKSLNFAIWGLVNWIADPVNTKVIVTSTTLTGARQRIWGYITEYFNAIKNSPGDLVDSMGKICTVDSKTGIRASDRCGIMIVAGEPAKEKESTAKLIGVHNTNVIIIGDELPELAHGLVNYAMSNLATNPRYQFIGLGNPNSRFDPHGLLSTPKGGWAEVTEEDDEWATEKGYAIRFDAEKSPNILAGKLLYPYLPTEESVQLSKYSNGEDSLPHWRHCRAFWCPEGSDPDCIYSEADIGESNCTNEDIRWVGVPTPASFCDPSWTHGGDNAIAVAGLLGMTDKGNLGLLVTATKKLADRRDDRRPLVNQYAEQFCRFSQEHGVAPKHMGYDATSGGREFGRAVVEYLGDSSIYAVDFSSPPTDIVVTNGKTAAELFADRVSEIWMVGKDFLREGQIRGVTHAIVMDMIARHETGKKRGMTGIKRAVESKREMRRRMHPRRSPDYGDAFFGLIDLCRARLKFRAATGSVEHKHNKDQWKRMQEHAEAAEQPSQPANFEDISLDDFREFRGPGKRPAWLMDESDMEHNYGFGG